MVGVNVGVWVLEGWGTATGTACSFPSACMGDTVRVGDCDGVEVGDCVGVRVGVEEVEVRFGVRVRVGLREGVGEDVALGQSTLRTKEPTEALMFPETRIPVRLFWCF